MIKLDKSKLLSSLGQHVVSETHIRIQVSTIPFVEKDIFFDSFHGEVLLISLKGSGIVKTRTDIYDFCENDQILITESEPFYISSSNRNAEIIVQFCWLPGPYHCDICADHKSK